MTSLLEVEGLTVTFGRTRAVDGVDLRVERGTLVGLIGSNGAGKTTVLDALTGFVRASGRARFDGVSLLSLPAHRRARLGMQRTWQTIDLFDDLTVEENLRVAASSPTVGGLLRDLVRPQRRTSEIVDTTSAILDSLGAGDVLGLKPTQLSQGQRKVVGLARSLVGTPRMLLADEPAAGLDTTESMRLGQQLRTLVDAGLTMLLVDHDMHLVLSVCDHIVVLDRGVIIAEGTPDAVRRDERVIETYLGRADEERSNSVDAVSGSP